MKNLGVPVKRFSFSSVIEDLHTHQATWVWLDSKPMRSSRLLSLYDVQE